VLCRYDFAKLAYKRADASPVCGDAASGFDANAAPATQ